MVESGSSSSAAENTPAVASVVERNIETLAKRRRREEARTGWQDRLADAITRFTGSMTFVYLHLLVFGFWGVVNAGLVPVVPRWDPSFIILATASSVEAIFLSTFILISQNRMAEADRKRADLDLQMNLLSEHEVTKVIALVSAIADHLGLHEAVDRNEVEELKREVAPEKVMDKIEDTERG